jgi:hydrogenase maturation protein HypF
MGTLRDGGGIRVEVDGLVQGVGFRPWVYGLARAAALRGRVWNHPGGVTIEAFGEVDALRAFVGRLGHPPMPAARVRTLRWQSIPDEDVGFFAIVASDGGSQRCPSIPPDLATCDDCWRELGDSRDRRYAYPFINCTRCGPRYTISLDVPYDRPRTTMAGFPMCEACRNEYEDPDNRRFHAQPNACPTCGPRVRLVDAKGVAIAGEPIATAARLLRDGQIVAVKGLGGYHLVCDATHAATVERLRARKQRDEKPFAVMVANLERAEAVACLTVADREMLTGSTRPIVLVPQRPGSDLVSVVAPGNPLVGLMLPYTPLHQLLLDEVRRPLVMTSGNRSDEPMACGDEEALRQLGDLADAFLQHDREIANRCDDSVARVIVGRPVLVRRGRGWTPGSLRVSHPFLQPILACGAHLKNTFCLGYRELAWLGPHVGDLETHEACTAFEIAIERFQRFVGITPEVVAHDLHPDYFTTRYAMNHPAPLRIAVQHHHAHVASAMAEHGLNEPVIGLAWDGTGYGTDGTSWGGELLLADFDDFRRLATFRPIPLAGGDRAMREVWRIALAVLDDAFDGTPPLSELALFDGIESTRVGAVRQMIQAEFGAPLARGVGRYFDAFGALALVKSESRYEGQIAMELTFAADPDERRPYLFEIDSAPVAGIDLRPTTRAAVADLLTGVPAATISGRFHATLVAAAVEMVRSAERHAGRLPVVLSGGCFQNARLVEDILRALGTTSRVYLPQQVPTNDGGIALGQAMIAGARLRGRLSGGSEVAQGAM